MNNVEKIERACDMLGFDGMERLLTDMAANVETIIKTVDVAEEREDFHMHALYIVKSFAQTLSAMMDDAESIRYRAVRNLVDALAEPEAVQQENKQDIADALVPALRITRAGDNVDKIIVRNGFAEVHRINGSTLPVNIECDSGIAMISHICRALM